MNMLRSLGLSLTLGYVLFYYGERVFWSLPREADSIIEYVLTWLVYSLGAYFLLVVCKFFSVRNVWAIFMAGACFGWLIEGLYAMTFFGLVDLPMFLSISWTGLAWHSLISVYFGVFTVLTFASKQKTGMLAIASVGIGLFWGLWSLGWALETPPVGVTADIFFLHACGTTILLICAYFLFLRLGPGTFASSRWGILTACMPVLAYGMFVTMPTVGPFMGILFVAFACVFYALSKNRRVCHTSILTEFTERPSLLVFAPFLLAPIIASLVYAWGDAYPFNRAILFLTTGVGYIMFVSSFFMLVSKK